MNFKEQGLSKISSRLFCPLEDFYIKNLPSKNHLAAYKESEEVELTDLTC